MHFAFKSETGNAPPTVRASVSAFSPRSHPSEQVLFSDCTNPFGKRLAPAHARVASPHATHFRHLKYLPQQVRVRPALRRSRAGRIARFPGARHISPTSRVDMPIACTLFSRRGLRRSRRRERSEGRTTRGRRRTSHGCARQRCGVVMCEPRRSDEPSGPSVFARERRVPGGGGISALPTRGWRIRVWNAATRPGDLSPRPSRSTRLHHADRS